MMEQVEQRLGNYRLIQLLGKGDFADVYLGEHLYLNTPVAIKVLRSKLDSSTLAGFLTEARHVSHLVHPHIIRVFDFGLEAEAPFLVMDYAPFGNLRKLHPPGTVVPLPTIVSYVMALASALQHAHDQHLIHRDLKPENVLLGTKHEVLLSDFGLALLTSDTESLQIKERFGTLTYMAPEQILGQPCAASDQYALAVMVYEWLSGQLPFGGSAALISNQHLYAVPASLHERFRNVPVPLTPLIGRERELQAAQDLLMRPDVRLVTLTGTGGIGKTHLALLLGNELQEAFDQGVSFVSLSTINDPELVIPAIARALGVQERGDRYSLERLKAFLRNKQLLVLLDNFEQVLPAAPLLSDLLSSCPQLKLLVTSRAQLHVWGEYAFPIAPLEVPDMQHLPERESLSHVASVALFVQRTQAILPGFQLTDENARDVAEICTRLEGVPLALEMAAARSQLLSPQALLSRLERPLEVLIGGRRDAPLRHQTLSNTLSWNDDLLSPNEQTLFRRLAVFVGGCSLQAAEAIATAPGDITISILDGVTSLIDKSLLRQAAHRKDEPRLYLFRMMCEYGVERLVACGELEQTRDAHTAYYLALAEETGSVLPNFKQAAWQERLENEHENLRAALHWLLERGRLEEALRIATALEQFSITHHRDELAVGSTEPLAPPTYEELTAREVEVLRLLSMGLSNKQIAGRLVLSPHAVSGHIQSIYGKLALKSRSAATRYALEHHLA